MRYKYKAKYRNKGTFGIFFYDSLKGRVVSPVIQFSFKNPWWIPKIDKEYFKKIGDRKKKNAHGWLAGWLFFYIGICISERDNIYKN